MAEIDGCGVAAVFAADSEMDVGAGGTAEFCSHIYEFANAFLVKFCERIGFFFLKYQEIP